MEANDKNSFTVKEIVVRLEAKVDKVIDDHENRLRVLERFTNKWSGSMAFILAIAALIVPFLR